MRLNRANLLHLAAAIGLAVLPVAASAQEEPSPKAIHREPADPAAAEAAQQQALQIAAATAAASDLLRRDVLSTPFDLEFTIEQVVRQFDAQLALTKAMQSADQIGSPRWRPDGSCEVRLVLSGDAVADAIAWAAEQPHVRPKAPALARQVRDGVDRLRRRTFVATGVSPAAGQTDRLPAAAVAAPWRAVSPQTRATAVAAARMDAVSTVLDGVAGVSLGNGKTLGDALASPEVADPIRRWFAARPLSDVEYRDDLKVRVMLAAPADELWPVVRSALIRNQFGPAADDAAGWERLRSDLERAVPAAEGRGGIASPGGPAQTTLPSTTPVLTAGVQPAIRIPADAPPWATQQIDATATAAEPGLRGAHAAQNLARQALRKRLDALALGRDGTLGAAATADPRVERAIDEALQRARVSSIRYRADQVEVTLTLDLELLWRPMSLLH